MGVQADGSADPRPRAPGDHQPLAADGRRGARPPTTQARRAFALDELDDRRDVSPLRGCIDVLRPCLSGFATDAEHVMVCRRRNGSRSRGSTLIRACAVACTAQVRGGHLVDGGHRRNQHDRHGTGDRSRVQIFAAEQFLAEQLASWRSAAPIHDPDSGEVLGAVDPSGPRRTSPRQPGPCPGSSRHARERPQVRAHAQRGPTGPGRSCTVDHLAR